MSKTLECHVRLWDEEVGVLASIKGKTYFQYEDSFLKKGLGISPLHLPLGTKVYDTTTLTHFEGLAGVFADALPDSWGNKNIFLPMTSLLYKSYFIWENEAWEL